MKLPERSLVLLRPLSPLILFNSIVVLSAYSQLRVKDAFNLGLEAADQKEAVFQTVDWKEYSNNSNRQLRCKVFSQLHCAWA